MPLPGTRVIHPRFEAHHAPVSAGAMTCHVRLLRPDTVGTRDDEAGRQLFADPAVIYVGPARIQARDVGRAQIRDVADRNLTRGDYLVVLLRQCPPALVRDLVEVVREADELDRVTYVVKEAKRGSLRWETDLGCDLMNPTNTGGAS